MTVGRKQFLIELLREIFHLVPSNRIFLPSSCYANEEKTMSCRHCKEAISYWRIGLQYLHLVQAVSEQTSETGNQFVVLSSAKLIEDEYIQRTRWSDHALVIPLLFDFYHGIEVVLKGFLIAKGQTPKRNHQLSMLLEKFNAQFPSNNIVPIMEPYILDHKLTSPLKEFCQESKIGIDAYYEALKYPQSKAGIIYEHTRLTYKGRKGVAFFGSLVKDIDLLRSTVVSLGRSVCPLT